MPTITFRVNLETLNKLNSKQPWNSTEGTNFPSTRSTWWPNQLLNNRANIQGDLLTLTGVEALYYYSNFTTGEYAFLDVVTYSGSNYGFSSSSSSKSSSSSSRSSSSSSKSSSSKSSSSSST